MILKKSAVKKNDVKLPSMQRVKLIFVSLRVENYSIDGIGAISKEKVLITKV